MKGRQQSGLPELAVDGTAPTAGRRDVIDITEDAEARSTAKPLGYVQAPVVVTSEDHWSGFRPEKVKTLAGTRARTVTAA